MAHAGVPAAAAVVVLAPGDRVLGTHRAAARRVGRLVHRREDVDLAARVRAEVVPLVRALPPPVDAGGRGVGRVLDLDGRGRGARGVVVEVGADQVAVPGPRVLGVGGRMDAGVPATGLDVALERALLGLVEHVAGGGEEDDDLVLGEVLVGEGRGVLGRRDVEAVGGAELLDGGDALVDVAVPEGSGLREDQGVELVGLGGGCHLVGRPRNGVARRSRLRRTLRGGGTLGRCDGRGCRLGCRGWYGEGCRAQGQRHDHGDGRAERCARALP